MRRTLMLGVVLLAFCPLLPAQGRGAGGGGMRQGQGQPGGSGQGMGMGAGNTSQSRAQTPQQDRYRECTESTLRLRKTLREMSRIQGGTTLSAEKARRYRERLRQQSRILLQERTDWLSTFTEEQTTEAQAEIASSGSEVQKLQDLLDIMDLELGQEPVTTGKLRQEAAEAEAATKRVEQDQKEVEAKTGSAPRGQ